jgi:hypothetical protein
MSVSFDPKFIHFATQSSSTLLNGLIAYWKMDETSGTNFTDTIGSVVGAGTSVASNATGILGKAAQFSTTGGRIMLPSAILNGTVTGSFTSSAWIKFDSTSATLGRQQVIYDFFNASGSSRIYLTQDTDNYFYFWFLPSSPTYNEYAHTDAITTVTGWTHVVCVASGIGNPLKIYVNGTSVETYGYTLTANAENCNYPGGDALGNLGNDTVAMNGLLDEIGFWNRALTSGEITSLYNSGAGRTHPFS